MKIFFHRGQGKETIVTRKIKMFRNITNGLNKLSLIICFLPASKGPKEKELSQEVSEVRVVSGYNESIPPRSEAPASKSQEIEARTLHNTSERNRE